MAACWGSSWIESSRRAGYIPSVRVIWLAACSLESKSTTKAMSSSPSEMAFVVVHQSWPPVRRERQEEKELTQNEGMSQLQARLTSRASSYGVHMNTDRERGLIGLQLCATASPSGQTLSWNEATCLETNNGKIRENMDRIQSFVNGLPSRLLPESLARYDIGRMPGNPHGRDTVAKLHSRHASEVTVSLANGRRSDCLPLSFSPTSSSSPSVFLSTFPVLKHCEYRCPKSQKKQTTVCEI